jgi:hypothetical protein
VGVAVAEDGVASRGVVGDGSLPRTAGVGVLSSRLSLGRGTRNGSAEPGREAGVSSCVWLEFESEADDATLEVLPVPRWLARALTSPFARA